MEKYRGKLKDGRMEKYRGKWRDEWMNECTLLQNEYLLDEKRINEWMNVPGCKMNIYWMRKVCNISSFWVINLKQRLFQNQSGLRKTFQTPESRNHYVSVLKFQDPLHKKMYYWVDKVKLRAKVGFISKVNFHNYPFSNTLFEISIFLLKVNFIVSHFY